MKAWQSLACMAAGLSGCFPSFDDKPWLIEDTRVLAIRGTPAEVRPGEAIELEALVVSPAGTVTDTVEWSFCLQPRTSSERTGVTQSCLQGDDLKEASSPATIPMDACARFGPNPPPAEDDGPPARPADPDPSGGYYFPIRALTEASDADAVAFGFQRLHCDLPAVTRDVFDAYHERYTLNENPVIDSVGFLQGGSPVMSDSPTVKAGASLTFRLVPAKESVEPYVMVSPADSTLQDREETLSVAWFVTAGELERGSESSTAADLKRRNAFENGWRAPSTPGQVFGWAVLQDDRGGATWSSFSITVTR